MHTQPREIAPLSGPYPVVELNYWAKSSAPGVFLVRNKDSRVEQVGYSDRDVRRAIAEAARQTGANEFLIEYAMTAARLFYLSCILFHFFHLEERQHHPEWRDQSARCPVPDCMFNPTH